MTQTSDIALAIRDALDLFDKIEIDDQDEKVSFAVILDPRNESNLLIYVDGTKEFAVRVTRTG